MPRPKKDETRAGELQLEAATRAVSARHDGHLLTRRQQAILVGLLVSNLNEELTVDASEHSRDHLEPGERCFKVKRIKSSWALPPLGLRLAAVQYLGNTGHGAVVSGDDGDAYVIALAVTIGHLLRDPDGLRGLIDELTRDQPAAYGRALRESSSPSSSKGYQEALKPKMRLLQRWASADWLT